MGKKAKILITFNCHWTVQLEQKYQNLKVYKNSANQIAGYGSRDQYWPIGNEYFVFLPTFPFWGRNANYSFLDWSIFLIFFPSKIFPHSLVHFSFFSLERLLSFLCHLVCLFICLLSLTFCSIDFIHCTRFCHCLFVYLICLSDYLHTHSLFALTGLKFSSCVNFYWPWAGDSPPVHFHLYQIILHSRLLECPFRDLSFGRG